MHSFMHIYWMWNSRSGFRIFTHIYGGLISLGMANRKAEVIDCVSLAVDLIKIRSQLIFVDIKADILDTTIIESQNKKMLFEVFVDNQVQAKAYLVRNTEDLFLVLRVIFMGESFQD